MSFGDSVSFLVSETLEEFAKAKIISVKETTFGRLTDEDWDGHEEFSSDEEMYETYSGYYGRQITSDDFVIVVKFEVE